MHQHGLSRVVGIVATWATWIVMGSSATAGTQPDLVISGITCEDNDSGGKNTRPIIKNQGDAASQATTVEYGVFNSGTGQRAYTCANVPILAAGATFTPLSSASSSFVGCCYGDVDSVFNESDTSNNYRQTSVTVIGAPYIGAYPFTLFNSNLQSVEAQLAIDTSSIPTGWEVQLQNPVVIATGSPPETCDGGLYVEDLGGVGFANFEVVIQNAAAPVPWANISVTGTGMLLGDGDGEGVPANVGTWSFNLAFQPDLAVSAIVCEDNRQGGRTTTCTVTNLGAAMSSATNLEYGVFASGTKQYRCVPVPPLPPLGTFSPVVAVSTNFSGCCYARVAGVAGESDTSNNYRQTSTSVIGRAAGSYDVTLMNPLPDEVEFALALEGDTVPQGWSVHLAQSSIVVAGTDIPPTCDGSDQTQGEGVGAGTFQFVVERATRGTGPVDIVVNAYALDQSPESLYGTWRFDLVVEPLTADLNGDGSVNGADLAILLGAWGTPNADLDGNGTTDGADLAILLGAWTG